MSDDVGGNTVSCGSGRRLNCGLFPGLIFFPSFFPRKKRGAFLFSVPDDLGLLALGARDGAAFFEAVVNFFFALFGKDLVVDGFLAMRTKLNYDTKHMERNTRRISFHVFCMLHKLTQLLY